MTRPRLHEPGGLTVRLTDPLTGLAAVFARSAVTGPDGAELPGPAITVTLLGPAGPVGPMMAATPRQVAGLAARLAAMTADVPAPRGPVAVPLHGGSASGSGGPLPAPRPACPACSEPVVTQDDGRVFHTDGTPACTVAEAS